MVSLDLVSKRGMVSDAAVSTVRQECEELCRILSVNEMTAEMIHMGKDPHN
jgi:hypothetical protein